jgi:hypothetical protein
LLGKKVRGSDIGYLSEMEVPLMMAVLVRLKTGFRSPGSFIENVQALCTRSGFIGGDSHHYFIVRLEGGLSKNILSFPLVAK